MNDMQNAMMTLRAMISERESFTESTEQDIDPSAESQEDREER